MRIIGGHDYYDSALAFGQDTDVVFVRDNRNVSMLDKSCPLDYFKHDIVSDRKWGSRNFIDCGGGIYQPVVAVSVYVAGNHYGGFEVGSFGPYSTFHEVFWDYDRFHDFVVSKKNRIFIPYQWGVKTKINFVREHFISRNWKPDELDWMIQNRAAVVTGVVEDRKKHEDLWHINPGKEFNLKRFQFQKVMDPYTLNQEIAMFVGGVLPRNPNPMVTITDDKVKAEKHGYDKWSFRRHKNDN
jgi:hypothetical protein